MAQLKDLIVNGATRLLNGLNVFGTIKQNGTAVSLEGHSHDDKYYTESEINTKLSGKSDTSHTHSYAGSSSVGGSATSAVKLDTATAGSATQPAYFTGGKPAACTYALGKSVPSDAKFTDTVYTHPTSSGNKHIPSGGSSGQLLKWSADGTAAWGADTSMPLSGGTFTGVAKAQNNTSYTTAQLRNVIISTANPSGGNNGDIWIKYIP